MDWLKQFRIVYWGDMDTHGFEALSLLRTNYPQTTSVMMSLESFRLFRQFAKPASPYASRSELHLSESESNLFKVLNAEGQLLEQERITLSYANGQLRVAPGLMD